MHLTTPHIPLGLSLTEALQQLSSYSAPMEEQDGSELCYRVDAPTFRLALYPEGQHVGAVWYDDSLGRESAPGIAEKIKLYLGRYGPIDHWELRLDNGWMHYWFNPTDRAAMVYGVHNDVLRFNKYTGDV